MLLRVTIDKAARTASQGPVVLGRFARAPGRPFNLQPSLLALILQYECKFLTNPLALQLPFVMLINEPCDQLAQAFLPGVLA